MRRLRILLVTPESRGRWTGNRVTAERWLGILRSLGHRVRVAATYDGKACEALVALHARKSHVSIARFRRSRPEAPLVVALTGTDLYQDIQTSPRARRSLELATRLVVLQREGLRELPRRHRRKARVIYQSSSPPPGRCRSRRDVFEVALLAHLRPVKDPFRAACAARLLAPASRIRVVHLGAALEPRMARRAREEERRGPRYRWMGEVPRGRALRLLARSQLLVLTSRLEGAGNALAEALACGVPVVSSRIPGVIGTLGASYPGYFPVGDTRALAALLDRVETDKRFYARLHRWCRRLRPLIAPSRERAAWRALLAEITRG